MKCLFNFEILNSEYRVAVAVSGPTSRCVEVSGMTAVLDMAATDTVSSLYSGATCHQLRCGPSKAGVLVTLHGVEFECPSRARQRLSDLKLDFTPPFGQLASIVCPDWEEMCSTSVDEGGLRAIGSLSCGSLGHCNGRGACFKGVCYCHSGYTGAHCHH